MKKPLVISILLAIAPLSFAATHNLDGRTLTVDELWAISAPGEKVAVTPEGWARIKASYKAPIDAATDGRDIYGLTVNYGALKDQKVDGASVEAEPNRTAALRLSSTNARCVFKLPVSNLTSMTESPRWPWLSVLTRWLPATPA